MKRTWFAGPALFFLVALVAFLFWVAQRSNPVNYAVLGESILKLQGLTTALERDLLRMRLGVNRDFDGLNRRMESLRDEVNAIRNMVSDQSDSMNAAVDTQISTLEAALKAHELSVELMKSTEAKLQNSTKYLSLFAGQLARTATIDATQRHMEIVIGRFFKLLFHLENAPDAHNVQAANAALESIRTLPAPAVLRDDLAVFAAHAAIVINAADDVNNILVRGSGDSLEQAVAALWQAYDAEQRRRAERFYELLIGSYSFAVLLLLYVGWILRSLAVTRRRERTSELRYRQIVDNAPDGIVTIDAEQRIIEFNHASENLFGYIADEVVGQSLHLLLPADAQAAHVIQVADFSRGTSADHVMGIGREVRGRRKDGTMFSAEVALARTVIDGKLTCTATVRDISERQRAANEIRKLNEELEARVTLRTGQLTVANAELRQSIEALRQTRGQLVQSEKLAALGGLVAGMAHEINTPLGIGVTSATSIVEELRHISRSFDEGTMKRSDFQRFLQVIEKSSEILYGNLRRAADLVRSFKQVAVDQGANDWRRIDLHDYVDEIILSLRPKLKLTSIQIENACAGVPVLTNPGALYQILSNLLINSLTHAFEQGEEGIVRIEGGLSGNRIFITYSDNGAGMSGDVRERIFEPFFTTKRGKGGSGLGLHIVYSLATETLGGEIEVQSAPMSGAKFSMSFPIRK